MCVCVCVRLTLLEGSEEYTEAALSAALVGPHANHSQRGHQHDVVGHRAAKLIPQVFHRAAAVVHRHEITFALIGVLHLVV